MTLLRTVHRDIRTAFLRHRPAPWSVHAATFAGAIVGRYGLLQYHAVHPEMILSPARTILNRHFQHDRHVRLDLSFTRPVTIFHAAHQRSLPTGAESFPSVRPILTAYPTPLTPVSREVLVHRLTLRRERMESGPLEGMPSTKSTPRPSVLRRPETPPPVLPLVQPVSMVVRRPDLADFQPSGESLPDTRSPVEGRSDTRPAPGSVAASAPSIDLGDMTDRVIRAIDQRIIAQRERMGGI